MGPIRIFLLLSLCAGFMLLGCDGDPTACLEDAGCDSGIDAGYTPGTALIGEACASNDVCVPGTSCRTGFQDLASEPAGGGHTFVGLAMPGGYCSNAEGANCMGDAECGSGECYRPLEGATDTGVLTPSIESQLDMAGVCLQPCTMDADCREAEGYRCQVPLMDDLDGVLPARVATYCVQDQTDPCEAAGAVVPEAGSCILEYDLVANFEISGSQFDFANVRLAIGPGSLVLRTVSTGAAGTPTDGPLEVLCYHMTQRIVVSGVVTASQAIATDMTPVATGALGGLVGDMTSNCVHDAATYGRTNSSWVHADTVDTPLSSCLSNYHSFGDVNCDLPVGCEFGGLNQGHNPQDQTWIQPFSDLEFSADFSAVAMGDANGPNLFDRLSSCDGVSVTEPSQMVCADTGLWPPAAQVPGPEADCYAEYCGIPQAMTELPNTATTRTWLDLAGVRTRMTCN